MKIILTTLCIVFSMSLFAQFSGYYDPANWTAANDPACGNGYTDASGAPATVTVVGSEGACSGVSSYTITAQLCGTITFDWSYTTLDCQGPFWDPFGYSVNGVGTQLTDSGGANNQSGSVSVDVEAGDVFALYVYSLDAFCGVAWSTISNFSAPDAVCYGDDGEVKMEICHNGKSLCIGLSAVAAHLAHGDVIGTCEENAGCEEEEQALYAAAHAIDPVEAKKAEQIQMRNATEKLAQNLVNSGKPVSVESYPNPAKDVVSFKSVRIEGKTTISVYDAKGAQVFQQEVNMVRGVSFELNVADLMDGIYQVKFENAAGQTVQSTITVLD